MERSAVCSAVCRDPAVASFLVDRGAAVVLYGADAAQLAASVVALRARGGSGRARGGSGGRVAVLVGDPADPGVEAAALTMARELFGGDPVVLCSVSDARQFTMGSGTVDTHFHP